MKLLDQIAELRKLRVLDSLGGVGRLRGSERNRVVSPQVAVLFTRQRVHERTIAFVEFMDRQQLDRRDAEPFQVRQLFDESGKRAGMFHSGRGVAGESA